MRASSNTFGKLVFISILQILLIALLFVAAPSKAFASGTLAAYDASGKVLYSQKVSNGDISKPLAAALKAGKSGKVCEKTTVKVPAGTYTLNTNTHVRIFSNTNLVLASSARITMSGSKSVLEDHYLMVEGSHFGSDGKLCTTSSCKHGGFSQISNISVQGGTWDANCAKHPTWNISCFLLQHGSNISFKDATFVNCTNHAVNVAGSKNVSARNCHFKNAVKFTGKSERYWGTQKRTAQGIKDRIRSTESFHTDFCSRISERTAYPLDNTPCVNVTVENCTFTNTFSGVGTHHVIGSSRLENILVKNCSFKLKDGNAVNLFACKSATVDHNTVTGGYCLARVDTASATIQNNTAIDCTGNAIAGVNKSHITVTGNIVKKSAAAGIMISDKSSGTITKNKITCPKDGTGINVSKGKATIVGNTIKGGEIGIALKTPTGPCDVKNNTIKKNRGNAIYVYKSKKGKVKVSGNMVDTAKSAGVRIDKSKKVVASKNTIMDCRFGFSISTSRNIAILKNTAKGGDVVIRAVDKCKGVKVANNTLKAKGKLCKGHAIYFYKKCTGKILSNEIVQPGGCGIRVDNKCKVKVKKNIVKKAGGRDVSIS